MASHVKRIHVDRSKESLLEGFIGVLVNVEVAAKAAVFIKSAGSTLSDLVESIGHFNKDTIFGL